MKSKNIIIIGIVLVIIIVVIVIFIKNKNSIKSIDNIKSFKYYYSTGNGINDNAIYEIKCSDECKAIIKPDGIPEEKQLEVIINQDIVKDIEKILNQYKVYKWNGFNKRNSHVLDGRSFSMYITTKKSYISSSGYMKYPRHYNSVKKEIDKIFMGIYKNN